MQCPRCTAECPVDSRFCVHCGFELGGALAQCCPNCQTILPDQARYCPACGAIITPAAYPRASITDHRDALLPGEGGVLSRSLQRLLPPQYVEKLLASRGTVGGERRVVTILFSDVKGSTSLAEQLDPEEVLEIMNGAFEVLIEPIIRYEGTLARLMGDAIMAFFGAPMAHEDDPERACHAALDIIKGARRYAEHLRRTKGIEGFNVRVGMNTGLVVVAEVGADLRVEYTAMGDAVNVAARMETAAEPGTILLTAATREHIGHAFDTEPIGPVQVKGKSESVHTFRLLQPRRVRETLGTFHGMGSPLVGRTKELHTLQNALRDLQNGLGGIVCITGDVGLGKSRLVQEARASCNVDLAWAEARAFAYTKGMSYQALKQLLQGLSGDHAPDVVDPHAAIHPNDGGTRDSEATAFGPYLSYVLSKSQGDPREMRVDDGHPEAVLPHAIQELCAYLQAIALVRPLVLMLDDLQWIDPSSLFALEGILPLVTQSRVLFLFLFRDADERMTAFRQRTLDGYGTRCSVVALHPLDRIHSSALLTNMLAMRTMSPDMREKMVERAGGNPFFLGELARQVCHPGAHDPSSGVSRDTAEGELRALPNTLRGVITARIDSLPSRSRLVLQTASVFGRSFHPELVNTILDEPHANPPTSDCLTELLQRGFITAGSVSGERDIFTFSHSLTHEVVHESLLITRRKELHTRAADTIQRSFSGPPEALAQILAVHYEIAGVNEKAFQCLMEAGEHAKSVYAHLEAINYFRRALKMATELGISGAMLRNLHEGLGDVYAFAAKYGLALEQYDKALELPQNNRRRAGLHRKKGLIYEKRGRYSESIQSFKNALAIIEIAIDLPESARIYSGLSKVYFRQGKYEAAVELGYLTLEIAKKYLDWWEEAHACNALALAHVRMGDLTTAHRYCERALEVWKEHNDSYGLSSTLNNLGQIHEQDGDVAAAIRDYEESISLCERSGNRHGLASAYDNLGQALARSGDQEKAFECLSKAVALLSAIETEGLEPEPEFWLQSGTW